jgi:hypothetical protein
MARPAFRLVEQLFHQAAARDPAQRSAFLDEACAGDTELRAAVEELLKFDDAAKNTDSFLANPLVHAVEATASEQATQSQDLPESAAATAPPSIPGYEVLEEVGRGGMGVVYKANQTSLNRLVALKMLLPAWLVSPTQLARFRTEAETLARLHHPNVVPIYDVGEAEGRPYFTMAYVGGPNLGKFLDCRPQDPAASARLVEVLARAVHAVHQCGIIHRDLKPANVLLALPDGQVADGYRPSLEDYDPRITDFGLAKDLAAGAGLTLSGTVMGTPCYMAPEQARGHGRPIGPAADVYSLGSILYEMLTGRPPFAVTTPAQIIAQLLHEDPLPPSRLRPGLPRDLVTICLKCLEKSPRQRYPSALALAEDLRRFLDGKPVQARPVGAFGRAARWCRRQPLAASFLGLSVGLALALLVTALVYDVKLSNALAEVETQKAQVESQNEDRRKQLVHLNVVIGIREWQRGERFAAILRFVEALDRDQGDADRETPHRTRIAEALKECPRLVGLLAPDKPLVCAHLDGAGGQVVEVHEGGNLEVWDVGAGKPVGTSVRHESAAAGGAVSPDGQRLAGIAKNGTVTICDLRTATSRRLPIGGPVRSVAFLNSERSLLTVHADSGIRLYDLTAADPAILLEVPAGPSAPPAISEDGRWLFTADAKHVGRLWDAAEGRVTASFPMGKAVTLAAVSKDGRRVAVVSPKNVLRFWDVATASLLGEPITLSKAIHQMVFSPDGKRLLTAGSEREALVWDVRECALQCTSPPHEDPIRLARFSPDGRLVVTADKVSGARVWEAATGNPVTPPLRHGLPLAAVAFSADSQRFTTAGAGGTVCVWDLFGGTPAPDSIDKLAELARLLAGARIDEDQTQVRLDAARLKAAWERVRPAP